VVGSPSIKNCLAKETNQIMMMENSLVISIGFVDFLPGMKRNDDSNCS